MENDFVVVCYVLFVFLLISDATLQALPIYIFTFYIEDKCIEWSLPLASDNGKLNTCLSSVFSADALSQQTTTLSRFIIVHPYSQLPLRPTRRTRPDRYVSRIEALPALLAQPHADRLHSAATLLPHPSSTSSTLGQKS